MRNSDAWRICHLNNQFDMCASYPPVVVVPAAASDETVNQSSKFRQDGRFPVLAYLHTNGVPLLRSSQPCSGNSNKRCKEDEKLLSYTLVGHMTKGFIVDTRSNNLANQQKNKGGGYELDHNYPQWKRTFHNLGQPSFLTLSVQQLFEACNDKKTSSWLSKLDGCGWMSGVENLLTTAVHTVAHIHNNASPTLVHGDSGM